MQIDEIIAGTEAFYAQRLNADAYALLGLSEILTPEALAEMEGRLVRMTQDRAALSDIRAQEQRALLRIVTT